MKLLQIIAFLTISIWGVSQAKEVFIPLCLAALLAFLLTPGVRYLRKHRVPESLSLVLVSLLFIAPPLMILYEILIQGEALAKNFPMILDVLKKDLAPLASSTWGARLHLSDLLSGDQLKLYSETGIKAALTGLSALFSITGVLTITLFFSLLLVAFRGRLHRSSEQIITWGTAPSSSQHNAIAKQPRDFIEPIAQLIQRFLLVRIGIVFLIAAVDWVVLMSFSLPYALLASAALGLSTLIPMIGFIFGILPAVLIAASAGFTFFKISGFVLTLLLISIIEGNLLSPTLLGRHLNLNLLVTSLGLFVGGSIWGGWGVFLSIPILGVVRIILASFPSAHQVIPWAQLMAEKECLTKPQRTPLRNSWSSRNAAVNGAAAAFQLKLRSMASRNNTRPSA